MAELIDLSADNVDITFSHQGDRTTMWINVDGRCRLRIFDANLIVCDGLVLVDKSKKK